MHAILPLIAAFGAAFGAGGCGPEPDFEIQGIAFFVNRPLIEADYPKFRAGIQDALDVAVVRHRKHGRKKYAKSVARACITLRDSIEPCGRHAKAWGCTAVMAGYIEIAVRPPEDPEGEHIAAIVSHELRHILQWDFAGKVDYTHESEIWWRDRPHK